jgi:hypothetical protein
VHRTSDHRWSKANHNPGVVDLMLVPYSCGIRYFGSGKQPLNIANLRCVFADMEISVTTRVSISTAKLAITIKPTPKASFTNITSFCSQ